MERGSYRTAAGTTTLGTANTTVAARADHSSPIPWLAGVSGRASQVGGNDSARRIATSASSNETRWHT